MLPPGVPVLSVEAATTFGWSRYADDSIGIDRFGVSTPGGEVLERLGINVHNVMQRARRLAGGPRGGEEMTHDRLVRLYEEFGQSPWLDNLKRGYLTSGQLARLRDDGIRGLTSNPTIFQKNAISRSSDYDAQFRGVRDGRRPDRGRLLDPRDR